MSFLVRTDDGERIVPCESLEIECVSGKVVFDISEKQSEKYERLAYKYVKEFYDGFEPDILEEIIKFLCFTNGNTYDYEDDKYLIINEKGDVLATYSQYGFAAFALEKFVECRNKFGDSCVFPFLSEKLFMECIENDESDDENVDYDKEFGFVMPNKKEEVQ